MPEPIPWTRRWPFRIARAVGIGLVLWILVLGVIAVGFGDNYVFFPSKFPEGAWTAREHARVPVDEIEIDTADGVKLVCWYARPKSPRGTLLFFHGNAGNVSDRLPQMELLAATGAEVFAVGYRGYGKSAGTPSEAGLYADAEAAWQTLTVRFGVKPERIVILGESLGGGPALELARTRACAGLILQSTFTSVGDMARRAFPLLPLGGLMRTKFDNLAKIAAVSCPKLVMHSRDDEIIPFEMGARLFEAATAPKWFAEYSGAGHNDLLSLRGGEYAGDVRDFLDRCLPK